MKRSLVLSTWYMKHGTMSQLSLGSSILLRKGTQSNSRFGNRSEDILLISAGHVMHPFQYPQYFPQEFLKSITASDISISLDIRDDSGNVLVQPGGKEFVTFKSKHFHPRRDICCTALSLPKKFLERLDMYDIEEKYVPCEKDEVLELIGHRAVLEEGRLAVMIPEVIEGTFQMTVYAEETWCPGEEIKRNLVSTKVVCESGMCGGPVVTSEGDLKGMIEGIVKSYTRDDVSVEGAALFIDMEEIKAWIDSLDV